VAAPPPSKPDRRFSRIRLSSRRVLLREGAALRLVPKSVGQTFGITQANCTRLIPPLASPRGHSRWFSFPSFCPAHCHLPAFPALHGRYPFLSYYGRSDSRQPGTRTVGPTPPPAPAGLPGFLVGASGHSISHHQRVVRGPPGCPALRLPAYRPRYRLRLSLADSPIHADRIEFTATTPAGRLCDRLVVLVPVLSTPCCHDAVPVRYRTALRRTGADFHRPIPTPSQAHERTRPGCIFPRPRGKPGVREIVQDPSDPREPQLAGREARPATSEGECVPQLRSSGS
jgi:hypothetical protein